MVENAVTLNGDGADVRKNARYYILMKDYIKQTFSV